MAKRKRAHKGPVKNFTMTPSQIRARKKVLKQRKMVHQINYDDRELTRQEKKKQLMDRINSDNYRFMNMQLTGQNRKLARKYAHEYHQRNRDANNMI